MYGTIYPKVTTMKRADLTNSLLERIIYDVRNGVENKIAALIRFSGVIQSPPEIDNAPFEPIRMTWAYASADKDMLCKYDLLQDAGQFPNEEIIDIIESLFRSALTFQISMTIPTGFWDMPLGYACKVAQARNTLDSFFPLSIVELALLADRKHTTIQQHCQRGSIAAVKDGRGWKVPPIEALRYLQSIRSEPFTTYYSMERYKEAVKEWLENDMGSHIQDTDRAQYYNSK